MYEPVPELAPIQENPIQSELGSISGMPQKPRGEPTEDSFDKYSPLITAGLAMMASKNPTALGAIGEGGLAGFGDLRQQQKLKRDQKKEDRELGQKDRALDLELKKIDTSALNDVEKLKVEREKSKILDDYYKGRLKADEAENQIRALSVRVMDAQRRESVTARGEDAAAGREQRAVQADIGLLNNIRKSLSSKNAMGEEIPPDEEEVFKRFSKIRPNSPIVLDAQYNNLLTYVARSDDDPETIRKKVEENPQAKKALVAKYGKAAVDKWLSE